MALRGTKTQKLGMLKLDTINIFKMANKKSYFIKISLSYPASLPNTKIIQILAAA